MEDIAITSIIHEYNVNELNEDDMELVNTAIAATNNSYSNYSHFNVGAAIRLKNGVVIKGCNQENAAYSVTICAERSALFAAGAQYPDEPVCAIAIAAKNADGLLANPITPCGTCRQAMIETEQRYKQRLRIILYGTNRVYVIEGIKTLMPLSFDEDYL